MVMLAARTPRTLFAAIDMPMPVPQTSTPSSASPRATMRPAWIAKSG